MKKMLVAISLFCTMLISNASAIRAPMEPIAPVETVQKVGDSVAGWGIVIAFVAIVLVMLLIKIRMNKKK